MITDDLSDDEQVYREDLKESKRVDALEANGMFPCEFCGMVFHESVMMPRGKGKICDGCVIEEGEDE